MNIEDFRASIDAIDSELLRLLNKRAQIAMKIGEAKLTMGNSICDPSREHDVIERRVVVTWDR